MSLRGEHGRSLAIDEGHECKVNRETKAVLNRAEAEYIEAQAHFLPF